MIDRQIDCILKPNQTQGRKGSLYIGNLQGASNIKRLKELGIKFVLTVGNMDIQELKEDYSVA